MISERIIRLSEKVRDTPVTLCLDRARQMCIRDRDNAGG